MVAFSVCAANVVERARRASEVGLDGKFDTRCSEPRPIHTILKSAFSLNYK